MSASIIDAEFQAHHNQLQLAINGLSYASADVPDNDISASSLVEGIFLQGFTAFERSVESLFLHYVVGGLSSKGFVPDTRLQRCTEGQARTILKSDSRYIDWSSPSTVKERSNRFFVSGEPFAGIIAPRSLLLSEAEKIRNRIAHDSLESRAGMKDVERARFTTERTFVMRAGQLLRTRRRQRPSMSIVAEHLGVMAEIISLVAHRVQ